jgi:hypothetical protein
MATIARQYQSPQWQLELTGTESPLSRWFGQTLLQDIRFALRQLDASGLISWQWRGEQDQLEQLQREFADRVNHLLTRSSLEPLSHDWPPVPGLDMPPKLSTLQFFDLAEVLDQWAADTVALPADAAPAKRFNVPFSLSALPVVPTWGRVAASAVAAVGVSAGIFQLLVGGMGSPQVASRPDPIVVAGQPVGTADQSFPGAIVAPGAVPSAMASTTPPGLLLPPVPTGASGAMPPPMASNTESIPVAGTLPPPAIAQSIPARSSIIPPAMRNARKPIVIEPRPIAQPPGTGIAPAPTADAPASAPAMAAAPVPSLENAPSSATDQASMRENQAAVAGVSAKAAEPALLRPAAPIAQLPPTEFKVAEPLPNTSQVTEAQAYFQQRWSPQKGLTFPLQYRLTIGKDGTVAANEPLSSQSSNWLDRSGVPLQGEPFVSALADGTEQTIVLTLRSNGGVEAVLEQVK